MMKEICGQCLQPHRDPQTGEVKYVFSCFNEDQPLDCVDFRALADRLKQKPAGEAHRDVAARVPARSGAVADAGLGQRSAHKIGFHGANR